MKKLLILILLFTAGAAGAQRVPVTKADYAAAERFTPVKVKQMLYSTTVKPNWLENSNRFWYSYNTPDGMRWWLVDPAKGSKTPLFDNHNMATQISRITKDPYDHQHLPAVLAGVTDPNASAEDKAKALRFTADERAFRFTVTSKVEEVEKENPQTKKKEKVKKEYRLEYNLASGKLTLLDSAEVKKVPAWGNVSPDGRRVVYLKGRNLWTISREDFDKLAVNDKDSTVFEQQLSFDSVAGFNFGTSMRSEGTDDDKRRRVTVSWSPDSRRFAIIKTDVRQVKELWVIHNVSRPRPTLETYRYQMPGEKEAPQYHLYVCDLADEGKLQEVNVGAFKDQIIGVINDEKDVERHDDYTLKTHVWQGGGDEFLIKRLSRDSRRMDFCRVNAATLEVKTVIEERSNFYLTDQSVIVTDGPGSDLIHWSEQDGWGHLYLYSWDGEPKGQITAGPWHVEEVLKVDPSSKTIYFTANGLEKDVNPYYNFFYSVRFDGSGLKLLTPGDYSHLIEIKKEGRYFVENVSRVDAVPFSVLRGVDGREIMQLEKADLSRMFAAGYKFPKRFKVKAMDGVTDLYGTLYLPYDLDTTKLYPVIEYVYPGPQQEGVQHRFHAPALALDRLAQMGFVVVTVGNRGGDPHRSKWYHTYGSGRLRDYAIPDKKAAAIQLADRYPFMDLSRVGITGHSGGGFLSTAAILQMPEFFKVAVSCAGNHDNSIYNRGWGEIHQGVTEEVSAKGDTTFRFKVDNNQSLAKNLQGRLLLVTGDVDNNVHPANTILVVNELIKAGKRFEMLVLPGQAHQFGPMNEYYFWRMADYFTLWLMGDRTERPVNIPQLRE